LVFRTGTQEFAVEPCGLIRLGIKARRDGRRVRIALRLAWNEKEAESAESSEDRPLIIESGQPAR
jgi:hypothetical protein